MYRYKPPNNRSFTKRPNENMIIAGLSDSTTSVTKKKEKLRRNVTKSLILFPYLQ